MNDEESIRIGIISHLADFMRHVGESWRESYLPIMTQILGGTSKMKWRLRESIAEQLKSLSELFSVDATETVLAPMACQLLRDDVAQVRQVALEVSTIRPYKCYTSELYLSDSRNTSLHGRLCHY